jgi:hypothetical protein
VAPGYKENFERLLLDRLGGRVREDDASHDEAERAELFLIADPVLAELAFAAVDDVAGDVLAALS